MTPHQGESRARRAGPTIGLRLAAAALLGLMVIACGGGTATTTAGPTAQPSATQTTPTPGSGGTPPGAVKYSIETVASGLDTPWEIAFLPDGRIFFTERPGRVRVIEDGKLRAQPVLGLPDAVETSEDGLMGMALDPNFSDNHWIYLDYTHRSDGDLVNHVVRYTEVSNTLTDPKIIIDGIPAASTHNGGRIKFGPDGKLYITAGDSSQSNLAQDRSSLAGKILRINADGTIPRDNPFPNSPVYSYGHRNPEGLAWQPGTNQLYATEHGPSAHDEINKIMPGANYGWPEMQGNAGQTDGFTPPVIESGADTTWAPTGATFVVGTTFPQWKGDLIFASLRGQTLWHLTIPHGNQPPKLEAIISKDYGRLRAVTQAPDGTIYFSTSNQDGRGNPSDDDDRILRIVPQH